MSSNFRAPKKLFGIDINEETCNEAIKRGLKIPIIPGILPVTNCKKKLDLIRFSVEDSIFR